MPGFPTGSTEAEITAQLGKPTQSGKGYWANTESALYDLVPDQVTVAYIYDKDTRLVRQTEASLAQSVDRAVMEQTLNGMLGGQLTSSIQQQLSNVWSRKSNAESFSTGSLKGTIERNDRDRIYMAVWQSDLH